jgi:hypothetical protein
VTDFFSALELELTAASERRPRRPMGLGQVAGALAVVALLATAMAVALGVGGGGGAGGEQSGEIAAAPKPDPVGTVIPRGEGNPPHGRRTIVVAKGVAPINGPWQIEVSRTKGQRDTEGKLMWRRGWCMWINLLDAPKEVGGGRSGFCGAPKSLGFRKTPGFSRAQGGLYASKPPPREVLVWGRVPDRAEQVVVTAPAGTRIEVEPTDGPESFPGRFYAIPVKLRQDGHRIDWRGARIDWLDADGKPGSRGIRLMPPITR